VKLDPNLLRRRPPGSKVLVYLDQSTLSDLCTDRDAVTRELLVEAVRADALVCPESLGHRDETLSAKASWQDISALQDELSMGVSFHTEVETARYESIAAAAALCGEPARYELWEETLNEDPHTSRDELHPGGLRVRVSVGRDGWPLDEVDHEKSKEATLQAAYDAARRLGRTFEVQADLELGEMLYWVLGPLYDPARFESEYVRKMVPLATDQSPWEISPGAPLGRSLAVSERKDFAEQLALDFPAIEGRRHEFVQSEGLRNMPALRYPPLFRAALATMAGRKAKRGDGYDIAHLTRGLSRCDLVTADGGMTQLVRGHRLVPDGCQLFATREVDALHRAVDDALS
jgi:hypothetical protein